MSMARYEIEIKSLLGEESEANALKEKMHARDPHYACVARSTQLNHYFKDGDIDRLF